MSRNQEGQPVQGRDPAQLQSLIPPQLTLAAEFDPAEAVRYNERTVAERINARLKDEFGGNPIGVKGNTKVMSHLMFGLLVLTVDQLMRLLQ